MLQQSYLCSHPTISLRYLHLSRQQPIPWAVDTIVTQPGYRIVADTMAQRVPILYTDRGDFPEYPPLVATLSDTATAKFIPQDELLAGDQLPYLRRLLSKPPN